jgi:hypothetical protein
MTAPAAPSPEPGRCSDHARSRPADRGRLWPEYAVCCADCAADLYVGTRNKPKTERALNERGWSWYGAGVGWVCPACVAAKSEQREARHG